MKASAYFTVAAPGKPAMLYVTAEIAPDWHIYSITQKPGGPIKTRIKLTESKAFKLAGEFKAQKDPTLHKYADIWPDLKVEEHEGTVTWAAPIEFAADTDLAKLEIAGAVYAQVCSKECMPPKDYKFVAHLKAADSPGKSEAPVPVPIPAPPAGGAGESTSSAAADGFDEALVAQNVQTHYTALELIAGAFFGGMLLNLMPCVFPVIGLKILSFVEQSHHDRRRLLVLNLWYTLGVVVVFLGLAAVAVVLRTTFNIDFKYGNQNGIQGYAIGMAAVMFVMGISLLGVWEIPIPGFLGSGKSGEIMQHEGAAGAVAKGAITTMLGASCSAPVVAVAFAFALDRTTPVLATFAIFALIGVGMASPYLILGSSPRLIRFLPKPGAWMDTFKHICGFIMLGAMVWVLTWLKLPYVAPTVAFLVGLWAACWWVGHVPLTEPASKRLRAWGEAAVFSVAVGWFAFAWLAPAMENRYDEALNSEIAKRFGTSTPIAGSTAAGFAQPALPDKDDHTSRLPWQPFSKDLLKQLTREHKTVMVDFTADWCPNCKTLEKFVLNTAGVKAAVDGNRIVPLVADYTDLPQEITDMLTLLKAGAVPVLAIFPAGDPNHPIVFRGGYTQQTLIDALTKAGPSQSVAAAETAMK